MGKYYEPKKTKSGYLICAVPSCQTKKSTTTLKTFEFPSDLKRRNQWISAIVDATLKNEEETSVLEDLYAVENQRMELEMELSGVLGDHSYVCARHFRPEDIVVHPQVCRLTGNAIPSIFRNYPISLPRQFFKKICQTAADVPEEASNEDAVNVREPCETLLMDDAEVDAVEDAAQPQPFSILSSPSELLSEDEEIVVPDSPSLAEFEETCTNSSSASKFPRPSKPATTKAKMRQRLRTLELRHLRMRNKVAVLKSKLDLYNIETLERDAANNNEEALFLLEMLRTYTEFEKTRNEILSNANES